MSIQRGFDISEPCLPRKRKAPRPLEVGTSEGNFHASPKIHFKVQYFEVLDSVTSFICQRFDQHGYKIYKSMQDLLIKAANREEHSADLESVVKFYGDNFDFSSLKVHLELLGISFVNLLDQLTLSDIQEHLKSLSPAFRSSMSEVCKLLKLFLVMPATNAVSERSASAVRRIKNYLRATMSQSRLNNLMILHIHKERTDSLCLPRCVNDFVAVRE